MEWDIQVGQYYRASSLRQSSSTQRSLKAWHTKRRQISGSLSSPHGESHVTKQQSDNTTRDIPLSTYILALCIMGGKSK